MFLTFAIKKIYGYCWSELRLVSKYGSVAADKQRLAYYDKQNAFT